MNEKEHELKRLREEAFRREARIQAEANRLMQQEEVIGEEVDTVQFCVNGLRAKVAELRAIKQECLDQEAVLKERLKIEGRAELGLAGYELN